MRVLDYLHRLKEFSPPDILEMDWDRRTTSFLSGETALAYCWTVRAARFESDVSSAVKRKVRYLPQPRGPGGASNNPMGGFLLCIPSNSAARAGRTRLRGDRLDDLARSDEGERAKRFSCRAALQCRRRPRGRRNLANRERRRPAREAKSAQGLASPAGARVLVSRSHTRRGDTQGLARGNDQQASACECADLRGPSHARRRLLLGPAEPLQFRPSTTRRIFVWRCSPAASVQTN